MAVTNITIQLKFGATAVLTKTLKTADATNADDLKVAVRAFAAEALEVHGNLKHSDETLYSDTRGEMEAT